MKSSNLHRKLSIDFELYTDGDSEFKRELVSLMIQNFRELIHALESGVRQPDELKGTLHKVAPTISMINDPEFDVIWIEVKKTDVASVTFPAASGKLQMLCYEVIGSLEYERDFVLSRAA